MTLVDENWTTVPRADPLTDPLTGPPTGPPLVPPTAPWLGLDDRGAGTPPADPPPEKGDSARFRRRRTLTLAAACIAASVAAGGAAGWAAGQGSTTGTDTTAAEATDLSATTTSDGLDVAGVVALAQPSLASVHTTIRVQQGPFEQEGEAAGTAIVLTADGLAVTNAHVIDGATSITVTLDGDSTEHTATVVATDSEHDIAVLQVEGVDGLTPATWADSDAVAVGDDVVAIGNALDLGESMSVTTGIISALDRTIDTETGTFSGLMQTDAAISSGNSGGALLDATGAVIGVNSAGATSSGSISAENIGFAIPSNTVLDAVRALGVDI